MQIIRATAEQRCLQHIQWTLLHLQFQMRCECFLFGLHNVIDGVFAIDSIVLIEQCCSRQSDKIDAFISESSFSYDLRMGM